MKLLHIIWSASLGLILIQGFVQCLPTSELSKPTILSAMSKELSSPYGSCSFPPEDVLKNVDTYEFLEPCNRKIPPVNVSISDQSLIMCMGLLEVGLRLCSLDQTYFDNTGHSRLDLPQDSQMFKSLLDEMSKREYPNLCSDFKKDGMLGTNQYLLINGWNLIKVFQETDDSCTRICLDYRNRAHIMCKLILWGNNQLMEQKPMASVITGTDNQVVYPSAPNLPQNNLSSLIAKSLPATGIESKTSDQDVQSQGLQTHDGASPTTNNGDIGLSIEEKKYSQYESVTGIVSQGTVKSDHAVSQLGANQDQVISSKSNQIVIKPGPSKSSNTTSSSQIVLKPSISSFQVENLDEDKPMEQVKPVSEASVATDEVIKTDVAPQPHASKVISRPTLKPNASEHASKQLVLGESDKLPLPTHQKQESSSSLNKSTFKAEPAIPVPSLPVDPMEATYENSPVHPIEKIPDGGQSEDDTSLGLDQNQDPDDINFQELEPQQPDLSHEPTRTQGVSNNFKYQQEDSNLGNHGNIYNRERFEDQEDSHFFSYFMTMIALCIVGYVVFHNKQKIMALALEGRSRRSSRRRPTTANYHKLDNNLEEAVSSPCSTSVTHVIY